MSRAGPDPLPGLPRPWSAEAGAQGSGRRRACQSLSRGALGMPDADQLRELLQEARFNDVRVARHALPLTFECADQLDSRLATSAIAADLDVSSVRLNTHVFSGP